MTKRILIPIASGIEEMETITIADIMVRAGYEVVLASANFDGSLIMKASRGFTLTADCLLVDVADEEFDMVVLPGGAGGCEILRDSALVLEVVKQQHYDGRWVAAICAAPAMVLKHHNLFPDAIMTCHPNFQDKLSPKQRRKKRVTVDVNHKLITSQGPGTALEFAMEIVITLSGKDHAWKVAEPMVPLPTLHYHELGTDAV